MKVADIKDMLKMILLASMKLSLLLLGKRQVNINAKYKQVRILLRILMFQKSTYAIKIIQRLENRPMISQSTLVEVFRSTKDQ